MYTAPQAGLPAVYTCTHTLRLTRLHTLMAASKTQICGGHSPLRTRRYRAHLYKLSLHESIFIFVNVVTQTRVFSARRARMHSSCDLARACPVCWHVGGMECVRNGAHTSSSRPALRLAWRTAGKCTAEQQGRNADK